MTERELKSLLQKPFSNEIRQELLDNLFKGAYQSFTQTTILAENTNKIRLAQHIGSVTLSKGLNVGIFDIEVRDDVGLKDRIKITKNRKGLRDVAAAYIDQYIIHGALVFFHSPDQPEYRLTFIARYSTFDLDTSDLVKHETAPKRYSFLIDPSEKNTTAARRLLMLIEKKGAFGLHDLMDAFSVERLNKEFFKRYREHYEQFWKYIAEQEDYAGILLDTDTQKPLVQRQKPLRDFTKKLLGRLVFLQFLQKKGWMGVPAHSQDWKEGDTSFTRHLFENAPNKDHFYSQCLVRLFFETLNTDKTKRPDYIFPLTGTKVPYLNGGLFDNDMRETDHFDFPQRFFAELFESFEQFNFTIDENSPDEQEVGIDPEMLGHIFENLLEENWEKGAFYTPKEIVHYMCQESLIQYLRTHLPECREDESPATKAVETFIRTNDIDNRIDKKNYIVQNASRIERLLDAVKICDPAIGSGAFPMGLLQEIFRAKLALDLTLDRADAKKHIIQNSIYGVDLEKGAVDIARLRFWLALVVDEDEPQPLPNLDYKIMQGNSLLESFERIDLRFEPKKILKQVDLFGNVVDQEITIAEYLQSKQATQEFDLTELEETYFTTNDPAEKARIKAKIDQFERDFISDRIRKQQEEKQSLIQTKQKNASTHRHLKVIEQLKTDLATLETSSQKLATLTADNKPYFLWHWYFMDVFANGGFDIVIGNPPYVRQESLGDIKPYLAAAYPKTYKGTADLLVYFIELGYNLLKKGGIFAYIVSNKWIRAGYGAGVRELLTNTRLIEIIDFGDLPVFQGAISYPCIVRFQKEPPRSTARITIATELPQKVGLLNLVTQNYFTLQLSDLDPEGWQLNNPVQQQLLSLLNQNSLPLERYVEGEAYYGLKTGLSDAFVVDEGAEDYKELMQHKSSKDIMRPFVMGRNVARYRVPKIEKHLLFIPKGFTNQNRGDQDPLVWFSTTYPVVYDYMRRYEEKAKVRSDKGDYWWELRACDYYELFDKPKIMYQAFQVSPCFIYDEQGLYCNNSMWFLPVDDKFLVGVLNSRLGWYAITQYCTKIQNGYQLIFDYFRKVPIAQPTVDERSSIETLVNEVLARKKTGKETQPLENQIDALVFALYGVSESQMLYVLDSFKDLSIKDRTQIHNEFRNIRNRHFHIQL